MTRLMYDSTSPWDIPRDAEMVAYYVDGRYAWPQAWLDMFPDAVRVGISAIGVKTAQVGDVEVGCIWPPANAVPWVRRARADGYDPTIYVNELNDWLPVRQAFWAAGEPEPYYWVARYNGVRQVPAGAVARQFAHPHDGDGVADNSWETGKHYDLSIVAPFWPGVDDRAPGGGGTSDDMAQVPQTEWERVRDQVGDMAEGKEKGWPAGRTFLAELAWRNAVSAQLTAQGKVLAEVAARNPEVDLDPEDLELLRQDIRGIGEGLEQKIDEGIADIIEGMPDDLAEQTAARVKNMLYTQMFVMTPKPPSGTL